MPLGLPLVCLWYASDLPLTGPPTSQKATLLGPSAEKASPNIRFSRPSNQKRRKTYDFRNPVFKSVAKHTIFETQYSKASQNLRCSKPGIQKRGKTYDFRDHAGNQKRGKTCDFRDPAFKSVAKHTRFRNPVFKSVGVS